MPGILPMKVIKVGTSSQARIAQACDRCRSKKIKCDGIRPCCSQCANVGFECKTSDKLSRRAFPRGYTESLEERVRSLEAEVRDLKDLLDEKDEKIDMLSMMHSNRPPSHSSTASPPKLEMQEDSSIYKDDVFRVQASPLLLAAENSDSYFMGASSGRAFVDAFKRKIQETGKSCAPFNTEAFLNVQGSSPVGQAGHLSRLECIPPRLFSDKCVQIYWQEWAPLFPILNKSSFLRLYEEYVADPEKITDDHKLAQLHMVFGIASISSNFPDDDQIALCENQWVTSLEAILMDNTLGTLQCLVLATIYCLLKGDYKKLQQYKGVSIALAHRLGLHQSQKRFSLGALTLETRKRTFWTLYAIDCFSAATVGLPKLLRDEDVHCEFPVDIDDDYVTEKGFLPPLPGESSKISNSLALFRVSRILSKVLEQNYPASASHDLSLQSLSLLDLELNEWLDSLPSHLKLSFVQDKPSTDVTGDRSALLSLAYYSIRTLIHRPAIGSSLGNKASSSLIALADSSKHIIQIIQLLEERNMTFSFCLNRNELLTLCGLTLLYQGLDLKQEGKLMKEGQRLVCVVAKYLEKLNAPGAVDFRRLAGSMLSCDRPQNTQGPRVESNMALVPSMQSAPTPNLPRQQVAHQSSPFAMMAFRSESDLLQQTERFRRATISSSLYTQANMSRSSLESGSESPMSPMSHRDYTPTSQLPSPTTVRSHTSSDPSPTSQQNLDFLPLNNAGQPRSQPHYRGLQRTSSAHNPSNMHKHAPNFPPHTPTLPSTPGSAHHLKNSSVTPDEWESSLLCHLDSGGSTIYDAVYGGVGGPTLTLTPVPNPSYHLNSNINSSSNSNPNHRGNSNSNENLAEPLMPLGSSISHGPAQSYGEWCPESWDMALLNMPGGAQSVLSYSEESLSSGDDLDCFGLAAQGTANASGRQSLDDIYRGQAPLMGGEYLLENNLDVGFGMSI